MFEEMNAHDLMEVDGGGFTLAGLVAFSGEVAALSEGFAGAVTAVSKGFLAIIATFNACKSAGEYVGKALYNAIH